MYFSAYNSHLEQLFVLRDVKQLFVTKKFLLLDSLKHLLPQLYPIYFVTLQ